MKEYDIYVPLYYNSGRAVESQKFQDLQNRLLVHFGGVTFFPQPNQGLWRMGDVTYRDEIVIYRVISADTPLARTYLTSLKQQLKLDLDQEEILIVERDVETL